MFKLYTPEFSKLSKLHTIDPSEQTKQAHQAAFDKKKEGDVKIYKKTKGEHNSLLMVGEHPTVVGPWLGSGTFGVVKKAIIAPTGEPLAIKRILFDVEHPDWSRSRIDFERKLIREDFLAEITVLKIMEQYKGHTTRVSPHGEKGYILMEYHEGKDLSMFPSYNAFTFKQTLNILLGIISQLRLLHDHSTPYLHNDLTPMNINIKLLSDPLDPDAVSVKLMDFAAARPNGEKSLTISRLYTDPKIIRDTELPRSVATDIYSFGRVAKDVYWQTDLSTHPGPAELLAILNKCTATDEKLRPTIKTLESSISDLLLAHQVRRCSVK